ncbi:TonB-dependent receptor domain-containing protein [Phenylobacterium sp. J367]|uniref:TonB-dependent receptor n=1 Tax=Phenylobacterium sp. J367 TaxID=2898435 RepID=UPI0027E24AD7|nr:TonB-dependent receptor [Phenylobacterium sp. J367]
MRGPRAGAADQPLDLETRSIAVRGQHEVAGAQAAVRLAAFQEKRGAGLVGARSNATGTSATVTLARAPEAGVGGWRLQGWVRGSDLENTSVAVAAGRASTTPANDQYATPAIGYGFNAALQGWAGDIAWEAGADIRLTDGEVRERFRFMNGTFTRKRLAGGKTVVGGGYVEGVLDRGPWLVTGGVRLDGWKSSDAVRREWDLQTGAATLDQTTPDASGTTPTARFGLRYEVADQIFARAAAYGGFRPPTLNELHRPFRVGNDITEANPRLKPETLQGVEAGLNGEGAVRWAATVFYNRIEDPIANVTIGIGPGTFPTAGFVPAGGVLRQRQNAGEITAWGFEGEGSGELAAGFGWRAALSYTDAEVDGGASAPQLTGLRPAQTPRLTVTGGFDWRPMDRLSLNADARYESDRWEDDLNTRKLGAGVVVDARAGWRVGRDSEVYVAADNLFDAELEVGETADGVESYSQPRTLRIGFAIRR